MKIPAKHCSCHLPDFHGRICTMHGPYWQNVRMTFLPTAQCGVIMHADSVFNRTSGIPGDEKLWLYSGAFASQACVFSNRFDSAFYYLNHIMPMMESEYSDDFLNALVYNTMAVYSLNTQMDYSSALRYYEAACSSLERSGDMVNLSALLCNIATLYYILRDSTGFDYALRAYELNKASPEVRAYTMTRSSILLAQIIV